MTNPQPEKRSARTSVPAGERPSRLAGTGGRAFGALNTAAKRATMFISRVPGTVHATQTGAQGTTNALRRLPDSTLRWLAASSVGLGAGFYLAGAPRLAIAVGVAPALFMGAAIVGRPIKPVVPSSVR
jgi:hypothetical protein